MFATPARCFPPVVTPSTRLLLLGSLPGRVSLEQTQYYAHPRNQFWRLTGGIIDVDLSARPYTKRLALLLARGIGLWDIVAQAVRRGSLDQNIRDAIPNSISELVNGLPQLRAIAFNGATADKLGRLQIGKEMGRITSHPTLISLPSSSPANTASYANKAEVWNRLSEYL